MQSAWAVILCKFQEPTDPQYQMFSEQYYRDLFTAADKGSPWNMVRYFSDYSHGNLDLSGSEVFGVYQLAQTVKYYNEQGQAARGKLINWARQAATDSGVNLAQFYSTVVCTNGWHDIGAWSYPETPPYGVVAMGPTAVPATLGEEMGHVYGLMHSRIEGSDADYQDMWDGMSA